MDRHAVHPSGPSRPGAPGPQGHGPPDAHLRRPLQEDPGHLPPGGDPDAAFGAINPLILASIIDNGISSTTSSWSSAWPSWLRSWPLVDAGLSLTDRRISANVGEGLIYDMRAKVFGHIQRMPLAFFTRTQTGALISRLNNDVHRRPAGVHRHAVVVVGNLVTVVIVRGVMFFL